jgi:hypothetical protein
MVNSSFIYPVPPGHLQCRARVLCSRRGTIPRRDPRHEGSDLYRTLPVGAPAAAMLAGASSMLRLRGGPLRISTASARGSRM